MISGDIAKLLGLLKRINCVTEDEILTHELIREYPDLQKTTGTLPGEHKIKLEESAKGVVHPPRRLPAAIRDKAIADLENMEANSYIKQVDKPTEWVSSMVVAVNKDKVRICIDPKDLNQVIKREHQCFMLNQDSFKFS